MLQIPYDVHTFIASAKFNAFCVNLLLLSKTLSTKLSKLVFENQEPRYDLTGPLIEHLL